MALRPLAFGIRLRDGARTLRVRNDPRDPRRFLVEDVREGEAPQVRHHETASDAVRDAASTWRRRLN